MAFSTFRGTIGASGTVIIPGLTDTYNLESPCGFYQGTSYGTALPLICAGSGNTYYAMDQTGSTMYAYVVTRSTSYTKLGTPLSITTNSNTFTPGDMGAIDSTHFTVVYPSDTNVNQVHAKYILNTTGTLSAAVGDTLVVTCGGASRAYAFIEVLDTSNALVLGISNTNSSNAMSLINPTTLSVTQSNTNASNITATTSSAGIYTTNLSSTTALVSWSDGSSHLQLASIDVVSGASFTINTAVSLGINGTYGAAICGISSTSALLVYRKSSSSIGARTVTVGSGGSITLNTEYTTTPAFAVEPGAMATIASYGTGNYITAYMDSNTNNLYSVSMTVTGNVVSFDTSTNKLNSAANTIGADNLSYNAKFAPIDSTHVALAYSTSGFNQNMAYTGVVDINPISNTWGTFSGNNSGAITPPVGLASFVNYVNAVWTGTNRVVVGATSTTLGYYGFDSLAGNSTLANFATPVVSTGQSNGVAVSALIGSASSGSGQRLITAYASALDTITTLVMTCGVDITLTLNTSTTFSTPVGSLINTNKPGTYTLVPLTDNTALFLNVNALGTYDGNIIQATTGANTIASTNTNTAIITVTGDVMGTGINFLQYSVIDSTHVAVLFQTQTVVGSLYNLKMCILSISGTTVTAGSIVNVYSGYTNPANGFGISTLGNGTGIIWYSNDATPKGTILYGNGFTYSGSTITLGSQNTLATSQFILQLAFGNPSMIAVSGTEAIAGYTHYSNQVAALRLLTYVNINSITAGSQILTVLQVTAQIGLIPTDNPNNTFLVFADTQYEQYYRG